MTTVVKYSFNFVQTSEENIKMLSEVRKKWQEYQPRTLKFLSILLNLYEFQESLLRSIYHMNKIFEFTVPLKLRSGCQ